MIIGISIPWHEMLCSYTTAVNTIPQNVWGGGLMNCDDCKHYEWYYDRCQKWDCEVDAREVHNCFEPRETPIRDAMVNSGKQLK